MESGFHLHIARMKKKSDFHVIAEIKFSSNCIDTYLQKLVYFSQESPTSQKITSKEQF